MESPLACNPKISPFPNKLAGNFKYSVMFSSAKDNGPQVIDPTIATVRIALFVLSIIGVLIPFGLELVIIPSSAILVI